MIYRGSRYEYATVATVANTRTGVNNTVLFYMFDSAGTMTYEEYIWKSGDRLDLLATDTYGKSLAWWMIMEHNPQIADPLNIPAGTIVRVPRAS